MKEELVDAIRLLEILFDAKSRPSLRWLRGQTAKRTIPFKKIGHKVYFDPAEVRLAIDQKFTVSQVNKGGSES